MSSTGNSLAIVERQERIVEIPWSGCMIWMGATTSAGYGAVHIGGRLEGRVELVHRLSVIKDGRKIPSGAVVRHLCDVPTCVNPSHLAVGTYKENAADAVRAGRMVKKLTESDIRHIRNLRRAGWTHAKIAGRYGVHRSAITHILSGRNWGHVT